MVRSHHLVAWAMWSLLLLAVSGLGGIATFLLINPPPTNFDEAIMLTPVVHPQSGVMTAGTGLVQLRTHVKKPLRSECLTSTQYFVQLMDGRTWKLPGSRLTNGDVFTESLYQTNVPIQSSPGVAWFWVLETYSCGARISRVVSPKISFQIVVP